MVIGRGVVVREEVRHGLLLDQEVFILGVEVTLSLIISFPQIA